MHFSFTLNLFLSITQYIDARININKKISFDIITLLFERRSNFVQNILYNPKQFQFHSQFHPDPDYNTDIATFYTDNYMSRTHPAQNIFHTQLTIPKIFQFLASNHFLTLYLHFSHVHYTSRTHVSTSIHILFIISSSPNN